MIPVALLTGFLGSGKTTLLNRLLGAPRPGFARVAIVVNELGDVGIDGDLLPGGTMRQVELPGGCICCQLNDDLETTINQILDNQPDVEAMVLETTGVAEPAPITWTLTGEGLRDRIRLAAVVTVVDAVNHETHRPMSTAVDLQVEYADLLVVSKLDLLDTPEVSAVLEASLRERNSGAPIVTGTPDEIAATVWAALADPVFERREHHHDHGRSTHLDLDSVALPISDTLDFEELEAELEQLPPNYLRIKGIAHMIDGSAGIETPRLVAFHRVGTRVSYEPIIPTDAPPEMRMVALGPGVDRARLARCLDAAVVRCPS
jgi:G3E family GTPase